jgi:hypothetical protein
MKTAIRELLKRYAAIKQESPYAIIARELVNALPKYAVQIRETLGRCEDYILEQESVAKQLEFQIKEQTLVHGETVTGIGMSAIVCDGRVTWDTKGLQGYAEVDPKILKFRKVGNPYVMIKAK